MVTDHDATQHNRSRSGCAEVAVGAGCKGPGMHLGRGLRRRTLLLGVKEVRIVQDRLCRTWCRQIRMDEQSVPTEFLFC